VKTAFRKSFAKDLKKVAHDHNLLKKVKKTIEHVETVENCNEIKNLKKLKAEGNYYRIRLGNYRIGLSIKDDTIYFVRILHRKDLYRTFP
jgi:mRNA interferase RelE/StbE